MNTGWCIENLGVVRDTAHRDLLELMKWGILVRQGSGRGTYYVMKEGTSDEEIIRFSTMIIWIKILKIISAY